MYGAMYVRVTDINKWTLTTIWLDVLFSFLPHPDYKGHFDIGTVAEPL